MNPVDLGYINELDQVTIGLVKNQNQSQDNIILPDINDASFIKKSKKETSGSFKQGGGQSENKFISRSHSRQQ